MRTIHLKARALGRYDDVSPFLLPAEGLEIQVVLPNERGGELFFVADQYGERNVYRVPQDGVFTLHGLRAGELRAEVRRYLRGVLVEVFRVEPLLISEADGALYASPEIETLTARIEEAEKEIYGLQKKLDEEQELRKEQAELFTSRLASLYAFAWRIYSADVFVNTKGLTAEDFLHELGVEEESIVEFIQNFKGEL